jgi:hypothetical protein
VNLPLALMSASMEHQRELMREFALIRLSDDAAKFDLPTRLLAVVERHRREYAALGLPRPVGIRDAIASGASNVDLEIELPRAAAAAATELLDTFAEADELCERGELLTLAAPPEVVAFRAWFLGEIVCQMAGEPPEPWPDIPVS